MMHFSYAVDISSIEDQINTVQDVGNTLTDDQLRSEYLKQEWTKMFEKNQFGEAILKLGDVASRLNPIFKVILGMEFSFSWLFFVTFLIYLLLIQTSFNLFTGLEPFTVPFNFSKIYKWIAFLVFVIIISTIRIPRVLANLVISLISGTGAWYIQLFAMILAIIVIIILFVFSKKLRDISKISGEKRKILEVEQISKKTEKRMKKLEKKTEDRDNKKSKNEEDRKIQEEAEKEVQEDWDAT